MRKIEVATSNGNVTCDVVRENSKTVIVQLLDGNIIKRHKRKHAPRRL